MLIGIFILHSLVPVAHPTLSSDSQKSLRHCQIPPRTKSRRLRATDYQKTRSAQLKRCRLHFLSDYCCKMETQTHYQQTINVLNRSQKYGYFKISKHSVLQCWYISVFPLLFLEYDYKDWIFESFQEILCWVTSNKGTQISIKCVSEIGHFWILANKEREWWYRTLEGCRAAWNHGEKLLLREGETYWF